MSKEARDSSAAGTLPSEGYEPLTRRAALVESRPADWLRLTGSDRLRFVNGLVSCDLRTLAVGEGKYGFFTDPKGRVLADAVFLETASETWIELAKGMGAAITGHLRKYLVADRVETELLEEWKSVVVAGPEAANRLGTALGESPGGEPWTGLVTELEGSPLVIREERRLGVSAWVLAGSRRAVDAAAERLGEAGLGSAGEDAVNALRIEKGVPWFGFDFGPEVGGGSFPQETGLEEWAVSFEKGCYLGQEVVARIHFRGKVNRSLRGLLFEPESAPRPGVDLVWNHEVVGKATSVARSPAMGCPLGLAIVHHKAVPGVELSTEYGPCRLTELPFGPAGEIPAVTT